MELTLEKVFKLIHERKDKAIRDLSDFIAIPSVSAKEQSLPEAAEFAAKLLKENGFEAKVVKTPGGPVTIGWLDVGAKRTLMFYDHADVQPAEPFELWDSPPFELAIRDGKLFGRGVTDNKGETVARIHAIKAWLDSGEPLPCNIKFVIETEEESSSKNLASFVEKNKDFMTGVDGCIWEFGMRNDAGIQEFVLGVKGILYVQMSVKLLTKDAHSGDAPMLPNAAERLLQAVASLKDKNNRILIPNFYDDIIDISKEELKVIEAYDLHPKEYKKSYGIDAFRDNLSDKEAKLAFFTEPTCNICGFTAGWSGEGGKTIIPKEATVKLDFRLVKNQDPEKIIQSLRKYLDEQGFTDVIFDWYNGYPPSKTLVTEEFVKVCVNANKKVYNHEPAIQSTAGGSGPMYLFGELMPVVSLGCSHPEANAHSPNENIFIEDFIDGMKMIAALLEEFKSW